MIELTATQLPRFMACNGSISLPKLAEFEPDQTYLKEGNAVHWLIEQVYAGNFTSEELIDRKDPSGTYITPQMVEHASQYIQELKGEVEFDTSFSGEGYNIKGRADNVSFENGILEVKDFKYGWGLIEPEENWTLIAHAIGYALVLVHRDKINLFTDVKSVKFTIYQPRPFHPEGSVRSWEISAYELNEYHKQLSDKLSNPDNLLNTGSHCAGCSSITSCSASVKSSMNAIDVSEKPFMFEISNEELPNMLDNLQRAKKVIETNFKAYEDLAMHRLKEGCVVNGYSLERGLSNRNWNEGITPETISMITGREDLVDKKLISPAQAIKKGLSEEIVQSLSDRKPTGMKLCRVDPDKKVKKLFEGFDLENLTTMKGN